MRRLWVIHLSAWLALAGGALGFQQERAIDMAPDSRIEIQLALPLSEQPPSGFFPVHLSINNGSSSGYAWELNVRSNGASPTTRFKARVGVPAFQRREFDVLVPWSGLESVRPGYQQVECTLSGPGVVNGQLSIPLRYGGGSSAARIGIIDTLGSPMWNALDMKLKEADHALPPVSEGLASARFGGGRNTTRQLHGSTLRLDELPADARALSGFSALWINEPDWRAQTGPRRTAIRQWVLEGGRLFVVGGSKALPGLPPLNEELTTLGFGEIRKLPSVPGTLPVDDTAKRILDLDGAPVPPWEQDFASDWPLRTTVGEPRLNIPLLVVFVCVFGILVGPVNLIWLAPPARRHRLFFTVPLFSIAASLLLLGLIAFGDGLGGDGARNVLMLVPAGENRLTLYQEQMVRTRLLFRRSFELPETVAASFIGQQDRDYSPISLAREGSALDGDWFRTRAVQGMYLRSSIPSRGAVVLRPGSTPELLSTMGGVLRHVHYLDDGGKFWTVDELATGRPAKLKPATREEYASWCNEVATTFSQGLRAQFQSAQGRRGYFYAEAEPGGESTIATLHSIRWNQQRIVSLGSCTEVGTP